MALDLLKRSENGSNALSLSQFDANYTAIENAVNAKAEADDARFTDSRNPLPHTHPNADLPELAGALAGKADQSALDAVAASITGFVSTSDSRLSNARAIADGSYTLFSVTSGVATLAANTIDAAKMANGSHGLFTYTSNVAAINTKKVGPTALTDADFGIFTVLNGVATLDANTVAPSNMANGDYGCFTITGNVAALDTGVVSPSNMANADFGCFTITGGVATLDNGVVSPGNMANADFGFFTITSGVAAPNTSYQAGANQIWVPAYAITPAVTSGATPGVFELPTYKEPVNYLAFPTDVDTYGIIQIVIPGRWNSGTITAKYFWMHPATTTNFSVTWGIQGNSLANDDASDTAWGTAVYLTSEGGTTYDMYISSSSAVTITSANAGELQFLRIIRKVDGNGTATNDDLAVDAWLLGVQLTYTATALKDA